MNPAGIFETLCCSADPARALAEAGDAALAALVIYLQAGGVNSGIPMIVRGLAETEIVRRWTDDYAPQVGAVGEGAL